MTMDAYALNSDGSAKDPKAFQGALRDDAERLAKVQASAAVAAGMLGDDLEQMQGLLREAHKVMQQRSANQAQRMASRSIDAQRASAPVPRDTTQLYAQLHKSGLQYGPAFRLLRNVHVPEQQKSAAAARS